jgi:biofilm PGA synthesis N-glycosyltransferase PgaC
MSFTNRHRTQLTPTPTESTPMSTTELLTRLDETETEAPHEPQVRSMLVCVIPAYNEAESIARTLESLLAQTRVPDRIAVMVNNTTDRTLDVCQPFQGQHERTVMGERYECFIDVIDLGRCEDKKVGALNAGFQYAVAHDADYLLGCDGDTTAQPEALAALLAEAESDPRIGGVSAKYSIAKRQYQDSGILAKMLLIPGQRAQFAAFNLDNLLRGRQMAVLGGQFSIFSIPALRQVMKDNHQKAPWTRDSAVEDSLLSLQLVDSGFLTKISAHAHAYVGAMTTVRALHAQQVKWTQGFLDLMWPGQRGDTRGKPLHRNLRLRWRELFGMASNLIVRSAFIGLLTATILMHAFVWNWLWITPVAVSLALNMKIALSMHDRSASDFLYAMLVPAECYMLLRIGHFLASAFKFWSKSALDTWAAQARAESGHGIEWLTPFLVMASTAAFAALIWWQSGDQIRDAFVIIGWPILAIITVGQTAVMIRKLFRRHRGYLV